MVVLNPTTNHNATEQLDAQDNDEQLRVAFVARIEKALLNLAEIAEIDLPIVSADGSSEHYVARTMCRDWCWGASRQISYLDKRVESEAAKLRIAIRRSSGSEMDDAKIARSTAFLQGFVEQRKYWVSHLEAANSVHMLYWGEDWGDATAPDVSGKNLTAAAVEAAALINAVAPETKPSPEAEAKSDNADLVEQNKALREYINNLQQ